MSPPGLPSTCSAVLMTAILCSVPWVHGGSNKQAGILRGYPLPAVSACQGVVNEAAELVALDRAIRLPWAGSDRQQVQALFARLKARGITIQPTFYKLLELATPAQRSRLVQHCQLFFNSVDTREIANTCCLTSMIRNKIQICSFLSRSDDFVWHVARTPALRSLASLFNRRGFPKVEEDTQAFMAWEVWWQGKGSKRTLDRVLLRIFSSMFIGRGLPDKKTVEDYLQWDIWWQGQGKGRTLNRERLRIFSSMFNGRGFPDKKAVEDYLRWDIWWQREGEGHTLDRGLLRVFSSMFRGRGLPEKKTVEDYLQWEIWWQGENKARTLDRELLRTFSSMFHGRGLPDKQVVDDYLQMDVWWQRDGQGRTLDRELLRVFSSMFSGRGLPEKKTIEDYLQWKIWWQGADKARTLDRKLLRVFSSMFSRKGLPDKGVVDNYLKWEIWWQGVGDARTLDRELLRAFSSIFHGKGLPDKKVVDNYLKWEIWWQGVGDARTLDRELLRTFSSTFHGKGLPDKKVVDDYLQMDIWWQREGEGRTLDRELLRVFSPMFCGRGLPDKQAVEAYLQWEIWWQGQGDRRTLDRQLLRIFSLMFRGKGFPNKTAVDDYLQWPVWWRGEGETRTLDRELFCTFSLMFKGRGLPEKCRIDEIMQWLTWGQQWDRRAMKVMAHLYSGGYTGYGAHSLPDINKLKREEQKLMELIPPEEREPDEDNDISLLIKRVVLYLVNDGGARRLRWTDCETWLREHPGSLSRKSLLRRLLLTLHYHGSRGIKEAVTLISTEPAENRWFVLDALGSGQALASVKYALQFIEPTERWEYLFFTKELHPLPCAQEWQVIKGYLETLTPVLPHREFRRRFLTLIWPFAAVDRERFVQSEAVCQLITLLPSVQVICELSKSLTIDELRLLFNTYLAYRASQSDLQFKEWADVDSDGQVPESLKAFLLERDQQSQGSVAHAHPPAVWLEMVLKQSVLSPAVIDQLYRCQDQLTSNHVVDILLRMDQSVSPDTVQRWYVLLSEKHQQALKTNPPWLDCSHELMEVVRDYSGPASGFGNMPGDLFSAALL